MSDWSVRQLIEEYRTDENTAPGSRGKPDYNDALQGVLAAMLMDEPSPLSSSYQSKSRPRLVRTTEEALGALLDSNYRGSFSPATPASSVLFNSSSRPSSAGQGIIGNGAVTTDDVLSYLVGDLGNSSGRESVRDSVRNSVWQQPSTESRAEPSSQTSKGDPVMAAANRLFDQNRYSLAADWKPGDPRLTNGMGTSPHRRESESGLDRADFALLPPALGLKPLTPLGEKDKTKASTPPEPVPTRTLIERKKPKESISTQPDQEAQPLPQSLPHDEIVRPTIRRPPRAKPAKRNPQLKPPRKKAARVSEDSLNPTISHDEEIYSGGVQSEGSAKPPVELQSREQEAPVAGPRTQNIPSVPNVMESPLPPQEEPELVIDEEIPADTDLTPELGESSVEEMRDDFEVPEPAPNEAPNEENQGNDYDLSSFAVIDDPAIIAMAENGGRMSARRRADIVARNSAGSKAKNVAKKMRKRGAKNTSDFPSQDNQENVNVDSTSQVEAFEAPKAPAPVGKKMPSNGRSMKTDEVSKKTRNDREHLQIPNEPEFDSQDSDSRQFGGALQKLKSIALKVNQKPKSPAAWITPRPAGQTAGRAKSTQELKKPQDLPSVQVELSGEIPPESKEPDPYEEPPSALVPYADSGELSPNNSNAERLSHERERLENMDRQLSEDSNDGASEDEEDEKAVYEEPSHGKPSPDGVEAEAPLALELISVVADSSPPPENGSLRNQSPAQEEPAMCSSIDRQRRSMPKRAVLPNKMALELMPVPPPVPPTIPSDQIVPARRKGKQTYEIQVSTVRAPATKGLRLESMQPGKLRRISICDEQDSGGVENGKIIRTAQKRIRVPALRWWAGERIEYKSEDGTLGRTVATAVYRKEDDQTIQTNQKTRLRRLKEPLALPTSQPQTQKPQTAQDPLSLIDNQQRGSSGMSYLSKCKSKITLKNQRANGFDWSAMKSRVVPALGVNRKNVVIRRADVSNGWDLYKKDEMCFSANVLLQNEKFASILFRLPPSETNGVDNSGNTHMLVEFVSGATILVLMSRESASVVEHGEIVGERKGVELSRVGSKVMIPPLYRYQFKNVSETEESLLITHVISENKQSFLSK